MQKSVTTVIMAAGEGTRMKSQKAKVLHEVCGRPIIDYVIGAAKEISHSSPVVVVGHGAQEIKNHLGDNIRYAYQQQRLGTGHAVMMARDFLQNNEGYAIVLAGDTPLITGKTLQEMIDYAQAGGYEGVILSAIMDNADGYGRIIRDQSGAFERIVEHRDANEQERKVKEINASMYCFYSSSLLESLDLITNNNTQNEYYLTDVLGIMKDKGKKIGVYTVKDSREVMGVNTRGQLAEASRLMRERINRAHMERGITLLDPENTYIGPGVSIGRDTVIYPGNILEGHTIIGEECVLYPNNRIMDSIIGRQVLLESSVVLCSEIKEKTSVGPFAFIGHGQRLEPSFDSTRALSRADNKV